MLKNVRIFVAQSTRFFSISSIDSGSSELLID